MDEARPDRSDLKLILGNQALRAFLYGFGSVILGSALASGGLSDFEVGVVFTAMLAGMATSSIAVGLAGGALLVQEHRAGHVRIVREPLRCLERSRVVADGVPAA